MQLVFVFNLKNLKTTELTKHKKMYLVFKPQATYK